MGHMLLWHAQEILLVPSVLVSVVVLQLLTSVHLCAYDFTLCVRVCVHVYVISCTLYTCK